MPAFKKPVSVLVVIHTPDLQVLLLERAATPGLWQSVTGSQEEGEDLIDTAIRETAEETGLDARRYPLDDWRLANRFEIYPQWRWRYAPGTAHNTEHVFSLLVPRPLPVAVAPDEHLGYVWLPWQEAAGRVFSWTNRAAIRMLPGRLKPA
ncbi:MAG: dihydroneopterin triphosphate diphosphatase [Pseudomonadota bacterium]|jgi:dATP pyrophosphohydrolase